MVPVNEVQENDILLIRNEEIIPTDGIVLKGKPLLDYSFVTGEAHLVSKQSGDKVFAGGKQQGTTITLQVTKTVDQSYLTKLWSQNSYPSTSMLTHIIDNVSRYFTWGLLLVTFISSLYWFFVDRSQIVNVVSSILIVACPCALALSAPFALGNVLRILGKKGFYLKNTSVIENLAAIKIMFFDKTGTLTSRNNQDYSYCGEEMSSTDLSVIKSLVRNSNHPLSRTLFKKLKANVVSLSNFKELEGKGLQAVYNQQNYKIGSALFVDKQLIGTETESRVYVSINNRVKGYFKFGNQYRTNILEMLNNLSREYQVHILSGDNDAAFSFLKNKLTPKTNFYFNQSPHDKLNRIKASQKNGQSVLVVGDGLNDAGALLQAQVGIAVAEDVNVFSPASDAIIDATQLVDLPKFINLCGKSLLVVKLSFVLSILYNIVGLYFAILGKLTPLIAAVLMPLSSITIVAFVTLATNILGKRIK
ncbi:heavy metal translocating P-type ATPase [Wenyingzhuangia sp. IMCC45533]